MAQFKLTYKENVTSYLKQIDKRLSNSSLIHMNTAIIARVIHAAITYNFKMQGRPYHWAQLSPIYAKIKATTINQTRLINSQPAQLGKYPTPWGKIGVHFGMLFGTLGTVLNVTPNLVRYGTIAPHASDFAKGHTVTNMHVHYIKNGKTISYNKSVNKYVQGRPFDYISEIERQAIFIALGKYITAPKDAIEILIPNIGHPILAPGGRRVRIFNR